jgi:hypothetical protein
MAMYQLNMARDLVLTLKKRRYWFRWMFAYLTLCVAVIAGVAYWLTASFVDLSAQRRAMDEREKRFLSHQSGVRGVEECLKKITMEMKGLTESLEAVNQFSTRGRDTAAVVLGFADSLPPEVDLGNLVLDSDAGTVKVEVYVPAALKLNNGLNLPSVITRWENSILLTNRVKQITSENSTRVSFEGRQYQNWRFTGLLTRDRQ